jgi:hypothetical protein
MQLRTEVGMRNVGQCFGSFAHGEPGQLGGPVLGDDYSRVMTRRGDHGPLGEKRKDSRALYPPTVTVELRQIREWAST